jgi:hypothetical protein
LADAAKLTLGPKGRNVVMESAFGAPRISKDGVSVAKEIELADPFENMGAQMMREVATKTSELAGDGTTTAVVLSRSGDRCRRRRLHSAGLREEVDHLVVAHLPEVPIEGSAAGARPGSGARRAAPVPVSHGRRPLAATPLLGVPAGRRWPRAACACARRR